MKAMATELGRMTAGCLLGALAAHLACAQQPVVDRIDAALLQKHHVNLMVYDGMNRSFTIKGAEANPRRPQAGHELARTYIASVFEAAGLTTVQDEFSFATSFGKGVAYYSGCANIVATLPGSDPATYGYYIIGAFYDTLDRGQPNPLNYNANAVANPGADMNASGVAAMLSLAEILSQYTFRSTIVFVAFDASQKNYGGAKRFLKAMTSVKTNAVGKIYRGNIKGMISIDTIGYNRKGDYYKNSVLLYGGNPTPTPSRKKMAKAMVTYGELKVVQGKQIQSSDHAPFHAAGIEAMAVHEGGVWVNPNLYTTKDSLSQSNYINYAYAARITKGVAGYICQRAGLVIP